MGPALGLKVWTPVGAWYVVGAYRDSRLLRHSNYPYLEPYGPYLVVNLREGSWKVLVRTHAKGP